MKLKKVIVSSLFIFIAYVYNCKSLDNNIILEKPNEVTEVIEEIDKNINEINDIKTKQVLNKAKDNLIKQNDYAINCYNNFIKLEEEYKSIKKELEEVKEINKELNNKVKEYKAFALGAFIVIFIYFLNFLLKNYLPYFISFLKKIIMKV